MPASNSLDFQIFNSITEVDAADWDRLSAGRPFTSHRWYCYGESVMSDCDPTYLVITQCGQPVARATFWRSPNEPLPIESTFFRRILEPIFRRWPLLMCQSPFASLPGVILPDLPLRRAAQALIGIKALEFLRQQGCSFLMVCYLPKELSTGWSDSLLPTSTPDPGTLMPLTWPSFEAWLEAGDKKDRQHYKRTLREAEKLGIRVTRHTNLETLDVDEALLLIRGVAHRFRSAENPWARGMIEHLDIPERATFLTAHIGSQLVGCGLTLEDNGAQTNTLLGLAEKVSYVYFMLIYESLKVAFEHHIHLIRLGSGAYDIKQQLGFSLEDNNSLLFNAVNPMLQKTVQWLDKHLGS